MHISPNQALALREALSEARRALTEEIAPDERRAIVAYIQLQFLLLDRSMLEAVCAA